MDKTKERLDQTLDLIRRFQDESLPREERESAKRAAIQLNLPLVHHYVKRVRHWGDTDFIGNDDLIQEGYFGLDRAVEHFDLSMKVKFATYAIHWIKDAVLAAVQQGGYECRLPKHVFRLLTNYRKWAKGEHLEFREPRTQALYCEHMGWSRTRRQTFTSALRVLSNILYRYNLMEQEDCLIWTGEPFRSVDDEDAIRDMKRRLAKIPARDRRIVRDYYGLNRKHEPMTMQQIADKVNLTRQQVCNIINSRVREMADQMAA